MLGSCVFCAPLDRHVGRQLTHVSVNISADMLIDTRPIWRPTYRLTLARYVDQYIGWYVDWDFNRYISWGLHKIHMIQMLQCKVPYHFHLGKVLISFWQNGQSNWQLATDFKLCRMKLLKFSWQWMENLCTHVLISLSQQKVLRNVLKVNQNPSQEEVVWCIAL